MSIPKMNRIKLNNIHTLHPYHIRRYRHAAKTHKPVLPTFATIDIGEVLLGIKNELSQLKQETIAIHARIDKLDSTLNARIDGLGFTLNARIDRLDSTLNPRVIKIISGTMLGCVGIAASLTTIYNFFTTSKQSPENRRAD